MAIEVTKGAEADELKDPPEFKDDPIVPIVVELVGPEEAIKIKSFDLMFKFNYLQN